MLKMFNKRNIFILINGFIAFIFLGLLFFNLVLYVPRCHSDFRIYHPCLIDNILFILVPIAFIALNLVLKMPINKRLVILESGVLVSLMMFTVMCLTNGAIFKGYVLFGGSPLLRRLVNENGWMSALYVIIVVGLSIGLLALHFFRIVDENLLKFVFIVLIIFVLVDALSSKVESFGNAYLLFNFSDGLAPRFEYHFAFVFEILSNVAVLAIPVYSLFVEDSGSMDSYNED